MNNNRVVETERKNWQDLMIPSVIIALLITVLTSLLYTLTRIAISMDLGAEWVNTLDFISQLVLYSWFIFSYLSVILLVIFKYWEQGNKFQLLLSISLLLSLLVPINIMVSADNLPENLLIFPQILAILIINTLGWLKNDNT